MYLEAVKSKTLIKEARRADFFKDRAYSVLVLDEHQREMSCEFSGGTLVRMN